MLISDLATSGGNDPAIVCAEVDVDFVAEKVCALEPS